MPMTQNEKIGVGLVIGGTVVFSGLWLAANVGFLNVLGQAAASLPPPDQNGQGGNGQLPPIDIEAAMPPASDFPQGWVIEDQGSDIEPGRAVFTWRLLRLNEPTSTNVTHISVVTGAKNDGSVVSGFGQHQSASQAYGSIEQARSDTFA